MTTQTMRNKYLTSEHAEKIHDVLLVSSFGLWALVLGMSPVLGLQHADERLSRTFWKIRAPVLLNQNRGFCFVLDTCLLLPLPVFTGRGLG